MCIYTLRVRARTDDDHDGHDDECDRACMLYEKPGKSSSEHYYVGFLSNQPLQANENLCDEAIGLMP